jgi:Pyruvate/2-oxoacid:ferredoxin oxidoreductase delta subunit
MLRQVVRIDEDQCDGCGLCVPSCAEGAIQIIDGKARLVSDVYCDGLGACLGECPHDAISVEAREAVAFDEEAAMRHVARQHATSSHSAGEPEPTVHACPGAASLALHPAEPVSTSRKDDGSPVTPSALANWPVQLVLAPVQAPYFQGARLLITADCVPFALPDFHQGFLAGRSLLIGCPKLDDTELYRHKLTQIFIQNDLQSVEVLYMEVPCCFGLAHLVRLAVQESGKDIPVKITKIGMGGAIGEVQELERLN